MATVYLCNRGEAASHSDLESGDKMHRVAFMSRLLPAVKCRREKALGRGGCAGRHKAARVRTEKRGEHAGRCTRSGLRSSVLAEGRQSASYPHGRHVRGTPRGAEIGGPWQRRAYRRVSTSRV